MEQVLEYFLKNVRGLGFAASVFGSLVALAHAREEPEWEVVAIWVGAFSFHRLGSWLDSWVYDPLFGVDGFFGDYLDSSRERARSKFKQLGWETPKGLYKTSEMVFEHSKAWESKVELALELSKAARTFVVPLLGLFIWEVAGGRLLEDVRKTWLGTPSIVGSLCLLSLLLYLGLRVLHNRALYRLVDDAKLKEPATASGMMEVETLPKRGEPRYSFYCVQN
jgi:hypothetical protein